VLAGAARTANTLSDYSLAERLARASVTAGGDIRARLQLGRALVGQHRFADAEAVLAAPLGADATDDDRFLLADTRVTALGGLGRVDDGLEIYATAERSVQDPAIRALLQTHRATLLMTAARFAEAADLGAAALDSVDDEAVRIRSVTPVGISLVMAGRVDDALALTDECLEPALLLQDRLPQAPGMVVMTRATALFFAGRLSEAIGLIEFATSTVPNLPVQSRAQANAFLGRYALAQGRPLTAARLLDDAAVTIRDDPSDVPAPWCLGLAAEAHALLGHNDQAAATAAEAASIARTEVLVFEADDLRALAWVDAQAGHTTAAVDQLWTAADLAAARGQRAWEIIILHDLLRLGERRAAERTRQVADHVDGSLSAAIGL